MINIAFVGVGHIHTPAFIRTVKSRQDVQCVKVWDHHEIRGQKRAQELEAAFVSDVNEIWKDKSIGAVIICSETNLHEQLVLAAAKAKKHMFVEKPLGADARGSYKMAAAIEKAGVLFQTGYFMRGQPAILFLREQVRAGNFGKITRVRASNCHSGALGGWFDSKPDSPESDWRWMADPSQSGVGGFGDLGTHSLDLLLWLFGEVESVTGQIDNGTARYENCDELGEALIRFKNGTIATLAAGWDDVANPIPFLISGTEGHATLINNQVFFQSKRVDGADGKQPWTQLPTGWPHAFDLFLNAINGQSAELVTPKEAAYRSAVMQAIYEGARTGKFVQPKAATRKKPRLVEQEGEGLKKQGDELGVG